MGAQIRTTAGRGRLYDNVLDTIGDTPCIRINALAPKGVTIYVKVEAFNPAGSVKDRLALAIITDAERRGVLKPGYLADLNIIALDELSLSPPEIVQDLPAGGTRLLQKPHGYRWTLKSGVPTFENGAWTGQTPGGLLRGEQQRG